MHMCVESKTHKVSKRSKGHSDEHQAAILTAESDTKKTVPFEKKK